MNVKNPIIVLLALIVMSCNSTKKTNPESNDDIITEKYWKLKTLDGKEISMKENQEREIYFILKTKDNRVTGFAGCNTLSGEFILEEGNRIRFKNMAVTMKACPDVAVNDSDFLEVFELADNYTIQDDILSLNVGKRAPLAVFEAVYMD
jgi:heat shock protein HslJ